MQTGARIASPRIQKKAERKKKKITFLIIFSNNFALLMGFHRENIICSPSMCYEFVRFPVKGYNKSLSKSIHCLTTTLPYYAMLCYICLITNFFFLLNKLLNLCTRMEDENYCWNPSNEHGQCTMSNVRMLKELMRTVVAVRFVVHGSGWFFSNINDVLSFSVRECLTEFSRGIEKKRILLFIRFIKVTKIFDNNKAWISTRVFHAAS